jgi:hypothetical protein
MQGIDVFFAVLSIIAAVCAASYLWIFLYRPAAFQFSLSQLDVLVWYKRAPGKIYLGFALFGLGFMLFKALESALWWMPGTVWIDGSYRPVLAGGSSDRLWERKFCREQNGRNRARDFGILTFSQAGDVGGHAAGR